MSALGERLRAAIPPGARPWLRRWRSLWYVGRARVCPCCGGRFRRFLAAGRPPRPGAACPRCGSLERHRLLWLYLSERTRLLTDPLRLLVIAPEAQLQARLRALPRLTYVSGDLESRLAMARMDLLRLPCRDGAFDAVLCSHVLEHVADVRRALAEIHRVLAPGGWAILQSPIDPSRATTFEDPSVVSPAERERVFGQRDHLRIFGRDYGAWLASAGFEVEVDGFVRERDPAWARLHGLDPAEDVYRCVKPVPGAVAAALTPRRGASIPRGG
ncbi:MAG TPA: class I SAM-dependent methyltransferase [Candidatus Eisenbacteria bacterium]